MITKTSASAESFLNVPCRNSFLSRPTPSEELGILFVILFITMNYILYLIINIIYNLNNAPIPSQNQPFSKKNSSLTPKKNSPQQNKTANYQPNTTRKIFLSAHTKKKHTGKKNRQPSQLPVSINTPFDTLVSHRTSATERILTRGSQGLVPRNLGNRMTLLKLLDWQIEEIKSRIKQWIGSFVKAFGSDWRFS